jgi:hypothetical protein
MRHQLTTGYGASRSQTILIVKGSASAGPPPSTISWANRLGTRAGTTALDDVARHPYVSGADVVYVLDNTAAARTFERLVDRGAAGVDAVTGVAVTRAPKR